MIVLWNKPKICLTVKARATASISSLPRRPQNISVTMMGKNVRNWATTYEKNILKRFYYIWDVQVTSRAALSVRKVVLNLSRRSFYKSSYFYEISIEVLGHRLLWRTLRQVSAYVMQTFFFLKYLFCTLIGQNILF